MIESGLDADLVARLRNAKGIELHATADKAAERIEFLCESLGKAGRRIEVLEAALREIAEGQRGLYFGIIASRAMERKL